MNNLAIIFTFLFLVSCTDIYVISKDIPGKGKTCLSSRFMQTNISGESGILVKKATSYIEGKGRSYSIFGNVDLFEMGDSVRITGYINGLVPFAIHAFHIHDFGNVRNSCMDAGTHYNPFNEYGRFFLLGFNNENDQETRWTTFPRTTCW